MPTDSSFADKFLNRLNRIPSQQIEQFLGQMVREKEFLEAVFNALTEGVIVAAVDGRVVFANDAAQLLLRPSGKRAGLTLRDLFRAPELAALARAFSETGEPLRQREVLIDGHEPRLFAVTVVPVIDTQSEATHSVWIIADQTETLRRMEEKRQAHHLNAMATLTAGIAHEIKNPLNSINIHAQLVQRTAATLASRTDAPADAERLKRSSQIVVEEIQRLTRIVDEFLSAARPIRAELRPASVNDVVVAVAELIGAECADRSIELVVDIDPLMPRLQIDPELFRIMILNLARNGIEAIAPPDAPAQRPGRLVLRTVLRADHALVEVEDNGCGIAEEDRAKIFEPYYTTKFRGTGLGLMAVYKIAQAHRARIGLTSTPGAGTIFHIAMPIDERPVRLLGMAEVEPIDIDAEPSEPPPTERKSAKRAAGPKRKK